MTGRHSGSSAILPGPCLLTARRRDTRETRRYARYIAARYGAFDVYFIVSGEWHAEIRTRPGATEDSVRSEFQDIGETLHEADPHNRMIAIHPMTENGSVREFNATAWMAFGDYQQNYRELHARILHSLTCRKLESHDDCQDRQDFEEIEWSPVTPSSS